MTTPSEEELRSEANQDATEYQYRVSVLYGDFGKRKTTTACSMIKERGLLISTDDSWKVLLNKRHEELYTKVGKIVKWEGVSQLEYIDYSNYDTIILDTLSRAVDGYVDLLYDKGSWKGKTGTAAYREQLVTADEKLKKLKIEILAPMDYRVTRDIFRPALAPLFKLPAHLIFTSQVTLPTPGLSKGEAARPSIPAATFKIVAERADVIGYITGANKNFTIGVDESSMSYLGKSRIEGIEGSISLDTFVKKYKEIVF